MAIKKRTSLPSADAEQSAQPPTGLNIVAKPKQPMPPTKITDAVVNPTRLGLVAQSCGDYQPDAGFTVSDRVKLLRTPFDKNNMQELRYRNRVKNRATAITAMCVVCKGSRKLVTECAATECPLWAFRFGSDPFHGKRK